MKAGSETTGIILAGGKSSRMGFEKGTAMVQGKQMIEWAIEALQPVCRHLLIVSNSDLYQNMDLPVYEDIYKDSGPLGGIYTGLNHSTTNSNLILACDMPFVTPQVLQSLLDEAHGYEIVVPSVEGKLQPLCAYYHKEISGRLEDFIQQKTLKMQLVIRQFYYKEWNVEQAGFDAHVLANINSPSELEQSQKK